jgi:Ser/Thr protein kinase RdoA (MazF antagonist)
MNRLAPAQAAQLAKRHWHISGAIRALPSYLDQNFRIRSAAGDFVLKVAHPAWSRADLDLENKAMLALTASEPGIEWPRVQFTPDGEHLLSLPIAGQHCHVRCLSFIPGLTYAQAIGGLASAQQQRLQESLGAAVARLTRGLQDFWHSAANRAHPWNLMQLPALENELELIEDQCLRGLVKEYFEAFCTKLAYWQARLPISVIHNDANDLNVIVAETGGVWRVRSIIDFGDLCTSFRLANLAIASAYAMQHATDPVACGRNIVRGYLEHDALTPLELQQLHIFITARLCQSILMAARACREQPDNAYILVSQKGLCALLDTLAGLAPDAIARPFLDRL